MGRYHTSELNTTHLIPFNYYISLIYYINTPKSGVGSKLGGNCNRGKQTKCNSVWVQSTILSLCRSFDDTPFTIAATTLPPLPPR